MNSCACFVVGAVVLRWNVFFEFCMAHRGSLEQFHQLPSLVNTFYCVLNFLVAVDLPLTHGQKVFFIFFFRHTLMMTVITSGRISYKVIFAGL